MVLFVEIVLVLLIILVPMSLLAVWLIAERDWERECGMPSVVGKAQSRSNSGWKIRSPLRMCHLELVNTENGFRVYKDFIGRLILGRRTGRPESAGFLYLEEEPTISRNQMRITETAEGFIIENLSAVNVTRLNGRALSRPERLRSRDYITVGKNLYFVSALYRRRKGADEISYAG